MINNLHKRHLRQTDYTIRWVSLTAMVLFFVSAFVIVPYTRSLVDANAQLSQEVATLQQDALVATLAITD